MSTEGVALNWLRPFLTGVLPLSLGEACVFGRLFEDFLVNGLDDLVAVGGGGDVDADLVPHPLAGGGEVEVWPVTAKLLMKVTRRPVGWPLAVPVAGFKERGAEEADLEDFAAYAVDLHPIADADAVFAHEDEPAEEGEDEVLKDYGEAGGGEAEDGWNLAGCAEDDEKNHDQCDELNAEDHDGAESVETASVHAGALKELSRTNGEQYAEEDQKGDRRERLQGEMSDDAVLEFDLREPLGVDGRELLLGSGADLRRCCASARRSEPEPCGRHDP